MQTELGVEDYTLSATIHVAYERKTGTPPVPVYVECTSST